jgi:HAMP domain-containing protein
LLRGRILTMRVKQLLTRPWSMASLFITAILLVCGWLAHFGSQAGLDPRSPAVTTESAQETAHTRPDAATGDVPAKIQSVPEPLQEKQSAPVATADLYEFARRMMHVSENEQACLAGTSKAAQPQKMAIHRWKDDNGIVHFSDQAPTGSAREHRRIEVDGLPPIVVRASGYDVNLPDDVARDAVASAQAIERILRDSLGVDGDPGLVLNVEFVASAVAYATRSGSPLTVNSAGNYSTLARTIHIRLQDDDESNFVILRHEITHALVHERIGRLPTAINEGLASYFEHIKVSGMGAQISISESRRSLSSARIEGDGKNELVELLARDGIGFYGAGQEQRYLRAFSLVAMLMQTPSGRIALSAVLAAQRKQPCTPIQAEAILDSDYPGGLDAMAMAWAAWLRAPPSSVQAF